MKQIQLENVWSMKDRLGAGGFGKVYRVTSGDQVRALKLVPKDPGADRELLFVDLPGAKNIVPVLEKGEIGDDWAMLMPLAECSLREKLKAGALLLDEAVTVLFGICTALASIADCVVHRDIKPENVLLLDGKWCLADFGIARYTEVTTDAETRKYALTPAYSAPERWNSERATPATDVYSVGVVAYELLFGHLPFTGPNFEDFRNQHLYAPVPTLEGVPTSVAAIVDECLYKAADARPSAKNLLARLQRAATEAGSEGRSKLADANLAIVKQRAETVRKRSEELSEKDRRKDLFKSAQRSYAELNKSLLNVISEEASSADITVEPGRGWQVRLGSARLTLSGISQSSGDGDVWKWHKPAIDVIAHATLILEILPDESGYRGRSRALWFCDAVEPYVYGWFETAFMVSPLINCFCAVEPFALSPGEKAAKALWPGMAEYQVAWPFERLERSELQGFIDRWVGWLADAATGKLRHPNVMPERSSEGRWRKK